VCRERIVPLAEFLANFLGIFGAEQFHFDATVFLKGFFGLGRIDRFAGTLPLDLYFRLTDAGTRKAAPATVLARASDNLLFKSAVPLLSV